MPNDVIYNQLIIFNKNAIIKCHTVKNSFTEKGNLTLILDDSQNITIPGKNIDTTGHKKRIIELVLIAEEKGFNIPKKSVKHYAKDEGNEYGLLRW